MLTTIRKKSDWCSYVLRMHKRALCTYILLRNSYWWTTFEHSWYLTVFLWWVRLKLWRCNSAKTNDHNHPARQLAHIKHRIVSIMVTNFSQERDNSYCTVLNHLHWTWESKWCVSGSKTQISPWNSVEIYYCAFSWHGHCRVSLGSIFFPSDYG